MLTRQLAKRSPADLSAGAPRPRFPTSAIRRELATPAAQPPSPNDPFANGTNAYYADEMYRLWKQDPNSVHASWNVYFSGLAKGLPSSQAFTPPPRLLPTDGVTPALHAGQGELDDHLKVCGKTFGRISTC